MGIWWAHLTHLCFFTEIPTPYESSLSRVDKCYLCHTLASCLAGMSPACWQSRPQWERCLCLRGGVRLGETKGAHSSEPPASRPSIPLSRRETAQECFTGLPRDGYLFPESGDTFTWCNAFLILLLSHSGLKSPQTGQRQIFFLKINLKLNKQNKHKKTCYFHTSCSLHFLLNNLRPSVSIAISLDRFPFLVFCAQLQIMTVFSPHFFLSKCMCETR